MSEAKALDVSLFGRQFRLACPPGEEKQLLAAVQIAETKMQELQDSGKVVGTERIALMAALNLAHELISKKPKGPDLVPLRAKVEAMQASIDQVLNEQDKLF
jgi:cell division protein ZapA